MADYKTVIDISRYNTITSWSTVAKNVDGVLIRCGYRGYGTSGTLVTDSKFQEHIKGASSAGIPLSVYFFTQAKTTAEAEAEADYTINLISGYNMSMPIFVDTEWSNSNHNGRADSLSKTTRTNVVKAFCDRIISKGYEAGIYASDSWYNSNLNLSSLTGYNLWVAKYSTTAPQYVSNYVGWQYSSSATISGVEDRVDISKWYGTIKAVSTESVNTSSTTSSSSSSSSTTTEFEAGDTVVMNNTMLYGNSTTTKGSTRTGTYYIWSTKTVNNRIRITNKSANVGKVGQVTGWVNISDISSSSSTTTTTTTAASSSSTSLAAGTALTLNKVNLYASSTATKVATTKTGTYYVWSSIKVNNRIRITNTKANVGKAGAITGWVNVSDI